MRGELVDRILSFVTLAAVVSAVFWLNDRAWERTQLFIARFAADAVDLLTEGTSDAVRRIDDQLVGRGDSLWPIFFFAGLLLVWGLMRLEHRR